jgi:hypothetical protein
MNIDIENPGAVINVLQKRLEVLESRLRTTETLLATAQSMDYVQTVNRLRLLGVIPLYIGHHSREHLLQALLACSDEHAPLLDLFWFLENAPVSEFAKQEFRKIFESGMERF